MVAVACFLPGRAYHHPVANARNYLICMLFIDFYHLEHNSKVISDLLNVIFKNNLIVCVKELRKLCTYVNAIEIPTKFLLMDHLFSVE